MHLEYSDSPMLGFPIFNNAVSGPIGAAGIQQNGTFAVGDKIFANAASYDLYPSVGSPLINAGMYSSTRAVNSDFNGKPRSKSTPTVGAYVSDSSYIHARFYASHRHCRNFLLRQIPAAK